MDAIQYNMRCEEDRMKRKRDGWMYRWYVMGQIFFSHSASIIIIIIIHRSISAAWTPIFFSSSLLLFFSSSLLLFFSSSLLLFFPSSLLLFFTSAFFSSSLRLPSLLLFAFFLFFSSPFLSSSLRLSSLRLSSLLLFAFLLSI